MKLSAQQLQYIYRVLYRHFGPQRWWPARSTLEVIIGAVLTQNTAWSNVEKAIGNLRSNKLLSFRHLCTIDTKRLARIITPAGYFNIKAKRLKNVLAFLDAHYRGDLRKAGKVKTDALRQQLLSVNGIGPETADSILLYAFHKPRFVVDAYTKRIFSRLRFIPSDASYEIVQAMFEERLPADERLFNEYHALLVRLGKEYCRKNNPPCQLCPLYNKNKKPCNL